MDWYLSISDSLAVKFISQIDYITSTLVINPLIYPTVKKSKFRRGILNSFPYKVIFRINNKDVYIIALIHTARSNKLLKED
ncbi:MAG: type II toxin-antitoxin system RelE/ParE family toxin [Ferruginibacter sp.]|nr:type II toxin-antitoxin system RelE/ParE family toxin [Ferruginibacter sp.]